MGSVTSPSLFIRAGVPRTYEQEAIVRHRRIGIVFPWSHLDTVPGLYNAVTLLVDHGYQVDLFINRNTSLPDPYFEGPVRLFTLQDEDAFSGLYQSYERTIQRVRVGGVNSLLKRAYPLARAFIRLIRGLRERTSGSLWALLVALRHSTDRYRCFIGVDPAGLVLSSRLTRLIRVPIAYYSLELLIGSEIASSEDRILKEEEIALSRAASFVLIQDETRARVLTRENGIPAERILLIPNSPLGAASLNHSRYWHERFDLPVGTRVALHAGSLEKWTGIPEIAAGVVNWPDDWVLVVHTRSSGGNPSILEELKQKSGERVLLSVEPVPRHEYDELVRGADAGIAFYLATPGHTHTGENISAIGLSSGKVAQYLKACVPVVVNRTPLLGDVVERSGCGLVVESPEGVGDALYRLEQDMERFRARACKAYQDHFDFESAFEKVLHKIESL